MFALKYWWSKRMCNFLPIAIGYWLGGWLVLLAVVCCFAVLNRAQDYDIPWIYAIVKGALSFNRWEVFEGFIVTGLTSSWFLATSPIAVWCKNKRVPLAMLFATPVICAILVYALSGFYRHAALRFPETFLETSVHALIGSLILVYAFAWLVLLVYTVSSKNGLARIADALDKSEGDSMRLLWQYLGSVSFSREVTDFFNVSRLATAAIAITTAYSVLTFLPDDGSMRLVGNFTSGTIVLLSLIWIAVCGSNGGQPLGILIPARMAWTDAGRGKKIRSKKWKRAVDAYNPAIDPPRYYDVATLILSSRPRIWLRGAYLNEQNMIAALGPMQRESDELASRTFPEVWIATKLIRSCRTLGEVGVSNLSIRDELLLPDEWDREARRRKPRGENHQHVKKYKELLREIISNANIAHRDDLPYTMPNEINIYHLGAWHHPMDWITATFGEDRFNAHSKPGHRYTIYSSGDDGARVPLLRLHDHYSLLWISWVGYAHANEHSGSSVSE